MIKVRQAENLLVQQKTIKEICRLLEISELGSPWENSYVALNTRGLSELILCTLQGVTQIIRV